MCYSVASAQSVWARLLVTLCSNAHFLPFHSFPPSHTLPCPISSTEMSLYVISALVCRHKCDLTCCPFSTSRVWVPKLLLLWLTTLACCPCHHFVVSTAIWHGTLPLQCNAVCYPFFRFGVATNMTPDILLSLFIYRLLWLLLLALAHAVLLFSLLLGIST